MGIVDFRSCRYLVDVGHRDEGWSFIMFDAEALL